MATIAGVSLSTPQLLAKASSHSNLHSTTLMFNTFSTNNYNYPWKQRSSTTAYRGLSSVRRLRPLPAAPEQLSDKVAESVKSAEEACAGDPESGECAAAWDEVEELSAAASHARDRNKETDVLETYCKDNPETDECRTYDN